MTRQSTKDQRPTIEAAVSANRIGIGRGMSRRARTGCRSTGVSAHGGARRRPVPRAARRSTPAIRRRTSRPRRAARTATTSAITTRSTRSSAATTAHAAFAAALDGARACGTSSTSCRTTWASAPARNAWWNDVLENGPSSPVGRLLRRRLDAGQGRAARQAAAADPRRSVRPRARARRAAARVRRRRARPALLRPGAADQSARRRRASTARGRRGSRGDARRRQPAPPRVPEHHRVAPEPAALHGDRSGARRRAAAREGSGARAAGAAGRRGPAIVRDAIDDAVGAFNGTPGEPASFDALHDLLEAQAYRLAYWRTASHEINYRRFFDVNTLAGLRVEHPEVFDATHRLLGALIRDGKVHAVRIDHPDGLFDPGPLFRRCCRSSRRAGVEPRPAGPAGRSAAGPSALRRRREDPVGRTSRCRRGGRSTARPATTT